MSALPGSSIETSFVAYIDDSGDSTRNYLLSALVISAALDERVRDEVETHFSDLASFFKVGEDFEFHGHELGSSRGGRDEGAGVRLREHERDFVFEHSLHCAGGLETARLYSVYWDWRPGEAKVGDDQTSRRQQTYELLLEFIEEGGDEVAAAYIDGTNEQAGLRAFKAHRDKHEYPLVIAEPELVASRDHRMIQLVDLVAYATYQCVDEDNAVRKPKYGEWYRDTVLEIAVDGGSRNHSRVFRGTHTPKAHRRPETAKQRRNRRRRREAAKWEQYD